MYDPISTEAARDAAQEAVGKDIYMFGQNIIREGETITTAQIEVLRDLGMIDDGNIKYTRYIALFAIELLLFLVFAFYLGYSHKEVIRSPKMLLTLSAVSVLALLVSWGGSMIHYYIIPVYFSAFICAMIVEDKSLARSEERRVGKEC